MADFGRHLSVGVASAGLAATTALVTGLATPGEMLVCLALGTAGSLAPDLDSDNSTPVRAIFMTLSIAAAFAALFLAAEQFSTVGELVVVWVAAFLFFRWAVFALLAKLTRHRGIFHSIPAALFAGLTTTAGFGSFLGWAPEKAWMAGSFVTFGYLVHLILDELYAVNLFGSRTRRSFGTALKLWSTQSGAATLAAYTLCLAAYLAAPGPAPFLSELSAQLKAPKVGVHLWPVHGWFASRNEDSLIWARLRERVTGRVTDLLAAVAQDTGAEEE